MDEKVASHNHKRCACMFSSTLYALRGASIRMSPLLQTDKKVDKNSGEQGDANDDRTPQQVYDAKLSEPFR